MSEGRIASLQRVDVRDVWPSEPQDFTTWLEDNIDELNNVIDLSLSDVGREQPAGNLRVDLVAEDESGNSVIIENQLGRSDHDHLGKLVTYLIVNGAKAAIWIVADPTPEHIRAISGLNESPLGSFYLLKIEAVRIENSPPTPLLTLIVGPSEEIRKAGETKKELKERDILRLRFWTQLLDRAKEETLLHANISAGQHNYVRTVAGKSGLHFRYVIQKHTSDIDLYIDRDTDADDTNERILDRLQQSKEEIEEAFGESLEWDRLEGKRACRIKKRFSLGGYRDDNEEWSKIQDAMIDGMIRLEKALKPHIDRLPG